MFNKRKTKYIADSIQEKINKERNKELSEEQELRNRLNTDTYKTYELDEIVEEHLNKLENITVEELELDSIWLGTHLINYYPIGKSMDEQVYSRRELEYMQKQFKKLGFETQISNSQVGFTPYIYLRLIWNAHK